MPQPCANRQSNASFPVWADPDVCSPEAENNIRDWEKWKHVQKILELIARDLSIHVLIAGLDEVCVCGTGRYYNGIRFRIPCDSTLSYTLRTGQSTLMLNPGAHDVCQSCSRKFDCDDAASFSGPVVLDGETVAVMHFAAFSVEERAELLASWNSLFELLTGVTRFVFMSSAKKFLVTFEEERSAQEFPDLVGQSPAMQQLRKTIAALGASDFPVLVHGESGSGKELVARSIHERGRRAGGPFVAVNCGAIPESLLESVLFGYEPGSFSGASVRGKRGLFEEADGGTFFMDEVSEMPPAMQVKLLRILQEKKVLRLGGKEARPVDFRLVAATNRNMRDMVGRGEFREDLFFRLDVLPVRVPPLRERTEDIPLLTLHYLDKFRKESGKSFRMTTELLRHMEQYHWPGNVRELVNMIWYGVTFAASGVLTLESLADRFHAPRSGCGASPQASGAMSGAMSGAASGAMSGTMSGAASSKDSAALSPQKGTAAAGGETTPKRRRRAAAGLLAKQALYGDALARHPDTTEGKRAAARELGVSLATLYRVLKREAL